MKEIVKNKVDLLISNRVSIEKRFKFSNSIMNIAASLIFTGAEREADIEKLKECKKIVTKGAGAFSALRATVEPILVCKMALSENPEQYFADVAEVYDKIKKSKIASDNGYFVQAAISIVDAGRIAETEAIIDEYKTIFKRMNKEHPILTGSEDIIFAVLLAMTDKDVDTIIEEMEDCYKYLKKEVKLKVGANEIQGLAEVLTLTDGNMREKTDKVLAIYNAFLDKGVKYGTSYNEFSSLGALIDLDVDKDTLVDETIEVAEYLKENKGFGSWSINSKQRIMFAAMLVGDAYQKGTIESTTSVVNSSIVMAVAEQVAIMACIVAATTASSVNS